jgi:hypothetical protein
MTVTDALSRVLAHKTLGSKFYLADTSCPITFTLEVARTSTAWSADECITDGKQVQDPDRPENTGHEGTFYKMAQEATFAIIVRHHGVCGADFDRETEPRRIVAIYARTSCDGNKLIGVLNDLISKKPSNH